MESYIYESLRGEKDRFGIMEWYFEEQHFHNKGLIDVLNILGQDGWQLVSKQSREYWYIMMKTTDLIN